MALEGLNTGRTSEDKTPATTLTESRQLGERPVAFDSPSSKIEEREAAWKAQQEKRTSANRELAAKQAWESDQDDTETIAKVMRLTGLPYSEARQQVSRYKQQVFIDKANENAKKNPVLGAELDKDPTAAISLREELEDPKIEPAYKDMWQSIGDVWVATNLDADLTDAGNEFMMNPTRENAARVHDLQLRSANLREGVQDNVLVDFVGNVGPTLDTMAHGLAGAGVGVVGGAAVGSVVPAWGTAAGAVGGAGLGFLEGLGTRSQKQLYVEAALDYIEIKDQDGNPIDPRVADTAAKFVATGGAFFEIYGLHKLAKLLGIGKVMPGAITKQSVKELLSTPQGVSLFKKIALFAGGSVAEEVAVEELQYFSQLMGQKMIDLSAEISGGDTDVEFDIRKISDEALETGRIAGIMAVGFTAPSLGLTAYIDQGAALRAEARRRDFEVVMGAAKEAKDRAKDKSRLRQYLDKIVEKYGEVDISIDAKVLTRLFQEAGVTDEQLKTEMESLHAQLMELRETGGDVQIPTADFLEYFAGSSYMEAVMADTRFHPDEPTANETNQQQAELRAEWEKIAAKMDPRSLEKLNDDAIRDRVRAAMINSGRPIEEVNQLSTIIAKSFKNIVARNPELAEDADALVDEFLPSFIEEQMGGKRFSPERYLLSLLRAGKVPTDRDIYGPSLLEVMAERGVQPLADRGGELAARDLFLANDYEGVGRRKIIRDKPDGFTDLTSIYEYARDNGYDIARDLLTGSEENAILELIDSELAGNMVRPMGDPNVDLLQIRDALEELSHYMEELGLDLSTHTDNEIVAKLESMRFYQGEVASPWNHGKSFQNLSKKHQKIIAEEIAKDPNGDRIMKQLLEYEGTNWAKNVIDGAAVRHAMAALMAGKQPAMPSKLDAPSTVAFREAVALGSPEAIHEVIEAGGGYVGSPAKAETAVAGSYLNCSPSKDCAKYCYATKAERYPRTLVKAELIEFAIKNDPDRAATHAAKEFNATVMGMSGHALRLFDRGDGAMHWLPFVQALGDRGVRAHIFTKDVAFFNEAKEMDGGAHAVLFSMDESNRHRIDEIDGKHVAYVFTGTDADIEFLHNNREKIQMILPVKLGNEFLPKVQTDALMKEFPKLVCMPDTGIVQVGDKQKWASIDEYGNITGHWKSESEAKRRGKTTRKLKGFTCGSCDEGLGLGCFNGQTKREAAAIKSMSMDDATLLRVSKAQLKITEDAVGGFNEEERAAILDTIIAAKRRARANAQAAATGGHVEAPPRAGGTATEVAGQLSETGRELERIAGHWYWGRHVTILPDGISNNMLLDPELQLSKQPKPVREALASLGIKGKGTGLSAYKRLVGDSESSESADTKIAAANQLAAAGIAGVKTSSGAVIFDSEAASQRLYQTIVYNGGGAVWAAELLDGLFHPIGRFNIKAIGANTGQWIYSYGGYFTFKEGLAEQYTDDSKVPVVHKGVVPDEVMQNLWDWDAPIDAPGQNETAMATLAELLHKLTAGADSIENYQTAGDLYNAVAIEVSEYRERHGKQKPLMIEADQILAGSPHVSRMLLSTGVQGATYVDPDTSATNLVIYDPKQVNIIGQKRMDMPGDEGAMRNAASNVKIVSEQFFSKEAVARAEYAEQHDRFITIARMTPNQFLTLAAEGEFSDKTELQKKLRAEGTKINDIPFLDIQLTKTEGRAVVVGHEGRHRMRQLVAEGYGDIPVMVNIQSKKPSRINWNEQPELAPKVLTDQNGYGKEVPMPAWGTTADYNYNAPRLYQDETAGARGYFDITGTDETPGFKITMTGRANFSTLTHESGHWYLEMLRVLSSREGASDQLKQDYRRILNFIGAAPGDVLTRDQHELFARSFEKYLAEGKAPSVELIEAFNRFFHWMAQVYGMLTARGINVELDDNIRGVFDRLLASDQEIKEARSEVPMMFSTREEAGMSEAQWAAYTALERRAIEGADDQLSAEAVEEYRRLVGEERKKLRKTIEAEERERISAEGIHNLRSTLRTGQRVDGGEIPGWMLDQEGKPIKMSLAAIQLVIPGVSGNSAGISGLTTKEGGLDPEQVAQVFGYRTAFDMLKDLVEQPSLSAAVKQATDARVEQELGERKTQNEMAESIAKKIRNTERAKLVLEEIKALQGMLKIPPANRSRLSIIRDIAKAQISRIPVGKLQPLMYRSNDRRLGKQAATALRKGDHAKALELKQQQLLNHYLYLESKVAKDRSAAIVKYLKNFDKPSWRKRIGKAGNGYLAAIDAYINGMELRNVSLAKIQRRLNLSQWISEREEAGDAITIPPALRNDAALVNWKQMSLGQLEATADAIRNIYGQVRLKNKLVGIQKKRTLDQAAGDLADAMDKLVQAGNSKNKLAKNVRKFMNNALAGLTKIELIAQWIDGGETAGFAHSVMFEPFVQAQHKAMRMMGEVGDKAAQLIKDYDKKNRKRLDVRVTFLGESITRRQLLVAAMNMGNAGNFKRLTEGYGWDPQKFVEEIQNQLTAEDFQFVQHIWNIIESMWPDIVAVNERIAGLPPVKIERKPVVLNKLGITLDGGYFPVVVDPNWVPESNSQEDSQAVYDRAKERSALDTMDGIRGITAYVSRGFTKERADKIKGAPLLLELSIIPSHMQEVIHFVTHAEAVMDVWQLLNHPRFAGAYKRAFGVPHYKALKDWISNIANDGTVGSDSDWYTPILQHMRSGLSIVAMGWSTATQTVQLLGWFTTADVIGAKYATRGLIQAIKTMPKHPLAKSRVWEKIREESGEMRNRTRTMDREIKAVVDRNFSDAKVSQWMRENNIPGAEITNKVGEIAAWMRDHAFILITTTQGLIDMGAYMGAYEKGMATHGNHEQAVREGESIVRVTQTSGALKDLARVQTGGEGKKLFTAFYSYFSLLFGRYRGAIRDTRGAESVRVGTAKLLFHMMWLQFLPTLTESWMRDKGPDDDDDESWLWWYAKENMAYASTTLPVVGPLVQGLVSEYDSRPAAALENVNKLAKGSVRIPGYIAEGEAMKAGKQAANVVGIAARLPVPQVWRKIEYIVAFYEGEIEDPIREFLFGVKRD